MGKELSHFDQLLEVARLRGHIQTCENLHCSYALCVFALLDSKLAELAAKSGNLEAHYGRLISIGELGCPLNNPDIPKENGCKAKFQIV